MPPPVLDDDFDGLDEVLDEMSGAGAGLKGKQPQQPQDQAQRQSQTGSIGQDEASAAAVQSEDAFPDPDDDGLDDELAQELEKQMQGFLQGLDGNEADMLAKLMQDFAAPQQGATTQTSPRPATASPSSSKPDFQSSIASTLEKMRQSEQSAGKSAPGAAGDDPAALLSSLLGGMGDMPEGDEESLQAMLDQMMSQLMSKDLLYEPLKEMRDKYPAYLQEHKAKLPKEEYERYEKQRDIINQIVVRFDDNSIAEDVRNSQVADLVKEMNECGAPPKELLGDMPEGLELGEDGMPKMMNECPVS